MDLKAVNLRIKNEISYKTIEDLSDINLINEYKNCHSVIKEINKLEKILLKYVNEKVRNEIIDKYLFELIPPGTKGVIRGNTFNKIVKQYIINLNLDLSKFDIYFERKCENYPTFEIPDWYILEKSTNKIIIGMNQLDLWNGGHQLNRGFKYLFNTEYNNINSKLLCVICNEIQFKSNKNKAFKLFKIGFTNNTLCYLNNLENIINLHFNCYNHK